MAQQKAYENYPCTTVIVSNILSILIYFIGAFIMSKLGVIWLLVYVLYILFMEISLLRKSCAGCYYYGKTCAFGKGRLAAIFFKKTNRKLADKKMTWKDLIPDLLVSLIPFITGIVLLIIRFSWLILALLIVLLALTFTGNGFIRGNLACKYCKQREIGCPAEQLFGKKK
jgi:hypothetical protein